MNELSYMELLGDIVLGMTAVEIIAYAAETAVGLAIAFGIKRNKMK